MDDCVVSGTGWGAPVFACVPFCDSVDPQVHKLVRQIEDPELLLWIWKIEVYSDSADLPRPSSCDDEVIYLFD
jgi:hypothetical protein